ncbi:MAG: hypothetical protein QW728_04380, partial [Thermoplasmata archaeon]
MGKLPRIVRPGSDDNKEDSADQSKKPQIVSTLNTQQSPPPQGVSAAGSSGEVQKPSGDSKGVVPIIRKEQFLPPGTFKPGQKIDPNLIRQVQQTGPSQPFSSVPPQSQAPASQPISPQYSPPPSYSYLSQPEQKPYISSTTGGYESQYKTATSTTSATTTTSSTATPTSPGVLPNVRQNVYPGQYVETTSDYAQNKSRNEPPSNTGMFSTEGHPAASSQPQESSPSVTGAGRYAHLVNIEVKKEAPPQEDPARKAE